MLHSTCSEYGGMSHAALNTFSISTRHWLPMNEFERAIFSFLPPLSVPGFSEGVLLQAVASNSAAAAAARSRPYRCTLMVAPPGMTATGQPRGVRCGRGGNRGHALLHA